MVLKKSLVIKKDRKSSKMDFLFFFVIKRLSMKSIHINKIIVI